MGKATAAEPREALHPSFYLAFWRKSEVPLEGVEPPTLSLGRNCSSIELQRLGKPVYRDANVTGASYSLGVKIFLATLGSRGDNEPFRALALEAASAGHEVFFAHTTDIPFAPHAVYRELELPGSMEAIVRDQGLSIARALASYQRVMKPLMSSIYEATTQQIREIKPDVVIYHPKIVTAATAAHSVGAIAVLAEMVPLTTPTSEFPPVGMPNWMPSSWNRASYGLVSAGIAAFGGPAKKLAKSLGVIRTQPDISLCPVSPTLIPEPADWPGHCVITGSWSVPEWGKMDDELQQFLELGPILYAGFGSMKDDHALVRAQALVSAARLLGMKTLLVTGWGGLIAAPDHMVSPDVMVRESVPHSVVLPRVDAAVHHGGAGTTAAMVHSSTPSVIMPFIADQPWWARRLEQHGLGPAALSRKTTNPQVIAAAIESAKGCSDALELAALQMAQEDGLAKALDILEQAEQGVFPFAPA